MRWQDLARINRLHDPDRLSVRQRLIVESGPATASPAPPGRTVPVPTARPAAPAPAPSDPPGGPGDAVAGEVTEAQLRAIMPEAGGQIGRFIGPLNTAMRVHGINTNERRAAFLAQISAESGQLRNVEENLNYSAPRLRVVWPRRFPTIEAAAPYAGNPEALGNHVYADRLGNGDERSGDGYRYRGRGLMQTTGRYNYRVAGFENDPDALARPVTAADSAGLFWATNDLNRRTATVLDREDFNTVSRTVNGGNHGSEERWQAYRRALRALQPASED
jgi:predicted chitinase